MSWRFLYSFWVSFLHPLTICHTVSVDSRHNLHSGVSDVLSMLYLTEFVLKACYRAARIEPSVSFFKKPFLSHLQDSSCLVSPLFFSSLLLKILFSNEHFLLQNHPQHPLRAIPSVAMQGFALLLNTLLNTNQPSLPFLSRQIQSGDITSGVKTAIRWQYLPSFPNHADYFFHCAIQDNCIAEYHPDCPILPFPRDDIFCSAFPSLFVLKSYIFFGLPQSH